MPAKLVPTFLIGLLILSACEDKTGGETPAPTAPAVAAGGGTPSGTYTFNTSGTKIGFVGAKITGSHPGSFGGFTGTITVPEGKAEASTVTVEIDLATVKTESPKLDEHLKSPDFFDVAKFPKAKFTSTAVVVGGAAGATHTITGNLELHGVTKPVNIPAKITGSETEVVVSAKLEINRKDFGIVYPGMPDDLIKDAVAIELEIKATR